MSIDIWGAAVVFIDMMYMQPIFQGKNNEDQLIKIFEVLGYPNEEEKYTIGCKWPSDFVEFGRNILHSKLGLSSDDNIIDLFKNMLQYNFKKRFSAREAY